MNLPLLWTAVKDWLSGTLGLTHTDLHLILGLALWLLFAVLLRRPLTSWLPLLPVVVLEVVNEALDALTTRSTGVGQRWFETIVGIVTTLLPPALIVLAARIEDRRAIRRGLSAFQPTRVTERSSSQ